MNYDQQDTYPALGLSADPGLVPLLIGAIGHRDPCPSEIPRIVRQFENHLQSIINACPSTPIWMLNGLAEGMDSIAAEAFLRTARIDTNIETGRKFALSPDRLIAVLPKDRETYIKDFHTELAKNELRKLIDASHDVIEPSNTHELRNSLNQHTTDPECYAVQGDFIAKYSYILFALYDGTDTGLVGGTSHTVAIHKGEVHPLFRSTGEILRSREGGEAIVIETPRSSCNSVEKHNQVQHVKQQLTDEALATVKYIDSMNEKISDPYFKPTQYDEVKGAFTKLWSFSDSIAVFHKKRYEKIAVLLVVIGFLLVATVDLYKSAEALGWGLVFIAFAVFPTIQKKLQKPFLTYRCLAESLTIQYIWSANDVRASTADFLFSHDQDDISRIRVILRTVALQLMLIAQFDQLHIEASLSKSRIWIKGQIDFLNRRIGSFRKLARRWKMIAYLFAGSGISTAALQLLPINLHTPDNLVNVLLAGFASSLAYQELMGYKETFERYEISLRQFERAFAALTFLDDAKCHYWEESLDSHYRHKLVLDAIGKEKIDELNEWMSNQLEKSYQPA